MKKVIIYTDGACSGNPGPGGWGALLIYNNTTKELYGGEIATTNNRMELMAAIRAIEALKETCAIELFTDSIYVKNGITLWINHWKDKGWKTTGKKLVKNVDLWEELDLLARSHHVNWHWIKGHSNDIYNDLADCLATKGRDEYLEKNR